MSIDRKDSNSVSDTSFELKSNVNVSFNMAHIDRVFFGPQVIVVRPPLGAAFFGVAFFGETLFGGAFLTGAFFRASLFGESLVGLALVLSAFTVRCVTHFGESQIYHLRWWKSLNRGRRCGLRNRIFICRYCSRRYFISGTFGIRKLGDLF